MEIKNLPDTSGLVTTTVLNTQSMKLRTTQQILAVSLRQLLLIQKIMKLRKKTFIMINILILLNLTLIWVDFLDVRYDVWEEG